MKLSSVAIELDKTANEFEFLLENFRAIETAMTYGKDHVHGYAMFHSMNTFANLSERMRKNVDVLFEIMRGEVEDETA